MGMHIKVFGIIQQGESEMTEQMNNLVGSEVVKVYVNSNKDITGLKLRMESGIDCFVNIEKHSFRLV